MHVSRRWLQFAATCFLLLNIPFANALAAASEPGAAASFECDGAVGVDSDIICSDALLRRADGELGRLYRSVLAEANGQARIDALKNDERNWILRRNSQCKVSKSLKLNRDQLPTYVDCFLFAYEERMDDLRRIRAAPEVDPVTISNPIRKSSFGDSIADIAMPAGALVETGLMTGDTKRRVLGFKSDDTLVVLGYRAEQSDLGVFSWKLGQSQQAFSPPTPLPSKADLCVTSKTIVVLVSPNDAMISTAQSRLETLALSKLPAETRRACSISGERDLVGNLDGSFALDLGPRNAAGADGARFVSVVDAQGSHPLSPPIRIDRRFLPRAYFNPGDGSFVVFEGRRPPDARANAVRYWAKTNCASYSVVDPATRRSRNSCIPFGSYADETSEDLVVPLQTRAGLYFAIASRGLFKVVDGTAKRVVAGPVTQPHVAPDDCSIAFIGSAGKTNEQHRVMLLDACAVQ
jgi:uncharacterized protein YecT (DUF1311 family)